MASQAILKMNKLPSLYWKFFYVLERKGLDDKTIARDFRLNKRDVRKARRELEDRKTMKKIEFWFGKQPNRNEVLKTETK